MCAQAIANSVTVKGDALQTPGTLTFENTYINPDEKMAWSLQPRAISAKGVESDGYTHLVLKADSEMAVDNVKTQLVIAAGTADPATASGSASLFFKAVSLCFGQLSCTGNAVLHG